jgi:dephospho-CoA kinase
MAGKNFEKEKGGRKIMPETHQNPSRSNLVIGLTGPFGSGCSTMYDVLRSDFEFEGFRISDDIRNEAREAGKYIEKGRPGWRKVLQQHGNEKRKDDAGYWVKKILERIDAANSGNGNIVIDGFRNIHEVGIIRSIYPRFFLVALYAEKEERWKRVQGDYGGRQNEFEEDDRRDKLEEFEWGQSVQKCVDDADYAFYNNEHLFVEKHGEHGKETPALEKVRRLMKSQAEDFVPLMKRVAGRARPPRPQEIQIAAAYAQSNASTCSKRHVGAVITITRDGQEFPISVGFNENPPNIKTCLDEGGCYKDEDMESKLAAKENIYCFKCGKPYNKLEKPWICECGASAISKKILQLFC